MKYLEIIKDGLVTWVYLNRPKSMNALSVNVLKEITAFNNDLKKDLETRVVIYTGKGENFSAGADLKEKNEPKSYLELWRNNFGKPAIESILNVDQITIAAVNGYCLGGAACIASACDFRIADTNSKLGYPEIDLGINLNWLGLPLAIRLIGPAKAKKLVIGGEHESSETLLSWGFYDQICSPEDLKSEAKKMASIYASKPPLAAQMIKKSVNQITYGNDKPIMHMDYDQTMLAYETKDRKEAVLSFFEKRKPKFTGE
jgi:enoyl-CoA hydratase/carnithine racemase|tara:strand:+ start:64 stop:837 length:774 start_codon:yes stop_codon:yes gene_type:complete